MDTGSPNRWKISVGKRVAIIQEETASATWRHCHLNAILLISFQTELNPQLFQIPHYGGRDHNGLHRSHSYGLQQRSVLPQNTWKWEMCMCTSTTSRRFHTKTRQVEQTHQSYCILQKSSTTADILRPTGNHLHEGYDMLQTSSLMARVQDLLDTDGRDWRFIPLRGPHFRGLESSSNIHDAPPEENIRFSHWHLWGTFNITCRDRGLSKLQNFVCSIRWSLQPDTSVSWTFFIWWTLDLITCCWLY